jgi:hypothetical protein
MKSFMTEGPPATRSSPFRDRSGQRESRFGGVIPAQECPGARPREVGLLEILPGLRHSVLLEAPETIARLLLDHLRR